MASGLQAGSSSGNWQKKVLCRFFVNGMCRAGDSCLYSHDRSLSNRGTIPCKYYSTGTCAYGDKCRFSHGGDANNLSRQLQNVSISNGATASGSSSSRSSGGAGASSSFSSKSGKGKSWADAPEFVPRFEVPKAAPSKSSKPSKGEDKDESKSNENKSWAQIVNPEAMAELTVDQAESQLCPWQMMGECRYDENCAYIHGNTCDMCGQPILHPYHEKQRKEHTKKCIQEHESEMEHAFAIAKSKDKTCGICMEVVMEKAKGEARFGIMPNCNHCFCLSCLRTWRQAKQFEHKIIRACPECRQNSDYICPSRYWLDTKEEKEQLFSDYKKALHKKECKYFKKGKGECPFGNKCFYRHANEAGVVVDVGPPQKHIRRSGADGESSSLVERLLLYDYLQERDGHLVLPLELLDVLEFLSDSDESDWSDFDWHQ